VSYNNIGDVRRDEGDREKALAIAERLAAQDPGNAGWQRDLAISFERIGIVRSADGDHVAARDDYAKALAIYKELKAKGVSYPDMARIERLLQAPEAP
jgi:eukaryotic-like serine/threonine-protein kinase